MSTKPFSFEEAQKPVDQAATAAQPKTFSFEEASGVSPDGAFARGWNKTKQSATITGRLLSGDAQGAAQAIKEADDYARRNPGMAEGRDLSAAWQRGDGVMGGISEVAGEFAKDWREAPGVVGGIRATAKNVRAMGEGIVEQVPNMIAPTVGLLGGTAIGGAAGSAVPLVGNVAGGLVGGWAGASAGNALVEGGGMAQEAIQKAGINPQDTAAVEKYLKGQGDGILTQAGIKGSIIGAVDVATMGIASKLLNGPARAATTRALADMGVDVTNKAAVNAAMKTPEIAAKVAAKVAGDATYKAAMTGAGNVARNAGAAALDPAGEFAGELVGQGVATGDWDTKNAALEAFSSIGQGGVMFTGQKAYQAATRPRAGDAAASPEVAQETPPPGLSPEQLAAWNEARLSELQDQEQVEPLGPQSAAPDGRAILDAQRAANRAEMSPDDEIYQSTGYADPSRPRPQFADTIASRLKPSEVMGLNPSAGALSREVAAFVDAQPFTEVTPIETRTGIGAQRRLGEQTIIDVDAREVIDPQQTIAARLAGPSQAAPLQQAVAQLPYNPATQGDSLADQAPQAIQAATQRTQAGAAQAEPALTDGYGQAWDSLDTEARASVARSAGARGVLARNVASKGWGDLSPNLRSSISTAIESARSSGAPAIQLGNQPQGASNVGNATAPQAGSVPAAAGAPNALAQGERGVGLSGNGDGVGGRLDGAGQRIAGAGFGEAGIAPVSGRPGVAPTLTQGAVPNVTQAGQLQAGAAGQATPDQGGAGQAGARSQAGGVSAPRPAGVEANGLTTGRGLTVTFGGKTYPVESVSDAQRKWVQFQETAEAGVSQVGNGVEIRDQSGQQVARVSFNGRAWDMNDNLIAEAPDTTSDKSRQAPAAPAIPPGNAGNARVAPTLTQGTAPILQNRNRSNPSSIAQMQGIAADPDYGRLGFSRDFANGAPVVAGGTVPADQVGRSDVAVASDGRRIPVQYAVVEASDVLASNQVDGTPNADYGNQSVTRIRAIAGNGRIAGLQRAYGMGTSDGYAGELLGDALHGVNPDVIRSMRQPVLVRVMPVDQVTQDIGDVSNTTGNLSLSPVEQANNDAQRVSLDALQFSEDGAITSDTVRQFVRAMPQAEQGGLIDTNGQPTKQAVDRINAAVFARAYGNDQLIRLFAQAQDPEARNVLSALAQVAPKMARLEGAGSLDIRDVVTQAAEIAVNARREGRPLANAASQIDMTADPMVGEVLKLFARNARTVRPVVDALGAAADFAYTEANKPAEDMFGAVPKATRSDVLGSLSPQNEQASQANLEQPAGGKPVQVDAVKPGTDAGAATDAAATQAGRPAEEEGLNDGQDWMTALFGGEQEQTANQTPAFTPRRDPAALSAALADAKREAEAARDDWASRTYKQNRTQVDLRGDGPSRQDSKSVSAINESRRQKNIEALNQEIAAIERVERMLASEQSASRLLDILNNTMEQAEQAVQNRTAVVGKTTAEAFEYQILQRLDIKPTQGAFTSNRVSKALLAYLQGEQQETAQQDAAPDSLLTSPTRADIEAQQDRAEQADDLDAKAQAKRESEVGDSTFMTGFTGDGRQDNTADLFGGAQDAAPAADPAGPAAPAQQEAGKPKKLPPFPVDGYRLERYYANGAKVKPLPAKAFSPTEVQAITDWFKSIGWSVTSGSGANGVNATNDFDMTVDDLPEPYTAAQRKKDEARKAADERAADRKKAQDDYLASNDAGKFVSDMFGDSMNRFNLTALAKVLAGDEETFGGLFSNRAADVLADAGIPTEGRQVKDVVADIKATFDAAQQEAQQADKERSAMLQSAKPAATIEDFGERLEGARKFLPPSLQEDIGDDQIASLPLSKVWPSDAHESIEDASGAALTFAARQEIPAKPRVAYKVRGWVEKVKTFRRIVRDFDGASIELMEKLAQKRGYDSLAPFFAKVKLLSQLPRDTWGRVEKVGEYPDARRGKTAEELRASGLESRPFDKDKLWLGGSLYRIDTGEPLTMDQQQDEAWVASPFSSVTIDGKTHSFDVGRIGPDEVQKVRELLGSDAPKKGGLTASDFEVRGSAKSGYRINRKGDSEYRALKTFTGEGAAKKALAWRDENVAELEAAWEAVKARDNVSKADVRRDENRERLGENRRDGKDVTPEMFEKALGFRGVQFGNWVAQGKGAKDRQGLLNEAYDAMLDLADVLGIPTRAVSLNGSLGLSLGARGAGKASAHFEPSNLVINLTKTRGAGTLAHEWFHALDNYFSRLRGGEVAFTGDQAEYRRSNYITYKPEAAWVKTMGARFTLPLTSSQLRAKLQQLGGAQYDPSKTIEQNAKDAGWQRDPKHKEGVRPEVERAFVDLVQALNESPMAKRASAMDKAGSDGYWGRIIERGARSFENYVINKLAQRGWSNDFLANVRDWKEWEQIGKNSDRYPYLRPDEEAPIVAAFDALFDVVETRETEGGNVAMFSRADQAGIPARDSDAQLTAAQQITDTIAARWKNAPADIIVARNMQDASIPEAVRKHDAELKSQGATGEPRGFIYKGKVYLLSDQLKTTSDVIEVLFHESLGHYGLRGVFGDSLKSILQQVGTMRRADVVAKAREYGLFDAEKVGENASDRDVWASMTDKQRLDAAEEVLAEMAQTRPDLGFVQRAISAIRNWLRANVPGFQNLRMKDADIVQAYLLPARGWVERGGVSSSVNRQVANEPGARYSAREQDLLFSGDEAPTSGRPGYETDLFGDPLPISAGRLAPARSAQSGVRGDTQPATGLSDTAAPEGSYRVRTIIGQEVSRKLGADTILTPEQAAQATAYLYRSAVERFDAIVTDKNGKPLAVVGSFKGALTQTSVYPGTVIAEAVRVPGAARIWFSHNHPSGKSALSDADKTLNRTLSSVFDGTSIEPMGTLAVTGKSFEHVSPDGFLTYGATPAPSASINVPVIERELDPGNKDADIILDSPAKAREHGSALYRDAGEPGLMILDAQHRVAAWVPVRGAMKGKLMGTGGLDAVYRAVSESNAGSVIIIHGGELDAGRGDGSVWSIAQNLGAALRGTDVRVLDIIDVNKPRSAAETGANLVAGSVFSRTPGDQTQTEAFKRWFGDWQALSAQNRLDRMSPVKINVPAEWRDLSMVDLRQRVRESLEDLAASNTPLRHPEIGEVEITRNTGVRKSVATSRDPAKLYVLGDLRKAFESSLYASETPASKDQPNVVSFEKLLARVEIGGTDLVAVFTVRRMADGRQFYNTVTLDDANSKTPAVSPRDTPIAGERATSANTRVSSFVRQELGRVNPDTVSKVVDDKGQPLVVYHGTWAKDFLEFNTSGGAFFAADPEIADSYTTARTSQIQDKKSERAYKRAASPRIIPVHLSIKSPLDWRRFGAEKSMYPIGGNVTPAQLAEATRNILGVPSSEALTAAIDKMPKHWAWKGVNPEEFVQRYIFGIYDEKGAGRFPAALLGGQYKEHVASSVKNLLEAIGYDGVVLNDYASAFTPNMRGTGEAYIAFRPEQIKSAIGNNGAFDPTNPDIRFSRTSTATGTQSAWDAPTPTGFDDVIYKLQDKNIDAKRVIEAITKSVGKVADAVNVYLQEELFHGRAASRVAEFGARELKPMLNQMKLAGLTMDEVEEFLHARHAKEANAVIAQRNPDDPGMQDGGSGMTNADADAYFAKLPASQRSKLEAIAKRVDAMIADTRKLYVQYGLEDQAVVDGWTGMFKNYIPLMRENKDGGMGIGQGFSVKGKEVKGRTGSKRKVVDILANIAAQREKVIVRGEKNRVAQALVGLAWANPNKGFWEVRSQAPTERVYDDKLKKVVDRPDPMFKSRDNVVGAKVKDFKGNVTEQFVVFNEDNPRAVRMAAAMKNLDAGNLEGLLGVSAKITRYFSAINTQYNPVFGVVNLVRDVQGAMINLAATPLAGQQAKIAKDTVSALAGIYGDIRKTRKGGMATSKWAQLWEQMQEDGGTTGYRELFKTSADRGESLKAIINPNAWMDSKWGKVFTADGRLKVPMSVAKERAGYLFGLLSDYNEAMENGVRLAAYKAALDKGMSRDQAASLAKNLTVNFNRKGQVGLQAGAVYAFFNAAMQGTARIGQTLFDMDGGDIKTLRLSGVGRKVVYGGVLLGVMQALALSAAGFDDEDPPEFVRERSLIIPTGGKTYISIPMPLGLHVIPGLGRHATEFALSGFAKPAERAVSVVGMFADAFNPIGNAGLSMQTIAPTALDPFVALSENRDWTGNPIARTSFNKAEPGHNQWKDTATGISKTIAEAINWISGGNEYVAGAFSPTPDQIDYLFSQVGGGVAREVSKIMQTSSAITSGEELPTYKMPLFGRFIGSANGQASQGSAFYANLNKLNALETEIKGLRKDGKYDEASALVRERPESSLIAFANKAERDVQKLRRDKRELIASDADRDAVRAKEDQITAVMTRLNELTKKRTEATQ